MVSCSVRFPVVLFLNMPRESITDFAARRFTDFSPVTGFGITEKKAGVLGLEQDKFVEAMIGFGRTWHGLRIGSPGAGSKFGKTTDQKCNA